MTTPSYEMKNQDLVLYWCDHVKEHTAAKAQTKNCPRKDQRKFHKYKGLFQLSSATIVAGFPLEKQPGFPIGKFLFGTKQYSKFKQVKFTEEDATINVYHWL